MIRVGLLVLAGCSVFLFPFAYAAVLVFGASLYVPLAAVSFGIAYDTIYYAHGAGLPFATLFGALGSFAAFSARHFIRTRISDFSL